MAAVEQAGGEQGLDILVANAGVLDEQDWTSANAEEWVRVLDVNLIGVMCCFHAASANMIRHRRKGRLLATSSGLGCVRPQRRGVLCEQGRVISMVKSAAIAFAPNEITAMRLCQVTPTPQGMRKAAEAQRRRFEDPR